MRENSLAAGGFARLPGGNLQALRDPFSRTTQVAPFLAISDLPPCGPLLHGLEDTA